MQIPIPPNEQEKYAYTDQNKYLWKWNTFRFFHHKLFSYPSQTGDPEKLFKRYYRHDSFQPVPGIGIGLTLVKDAAEKSASDINFQLEDDHIIFILSIPICKP